VGGTAPTITSALGWSLANSLVARLGTVLLGLVLARLLVPEAYGGFAVALVVLVVAQSMNELGVSVVVLRSGVTGSERTATTLALGSSVIVAGVVVASAPAISGAFGVPGAVRLVQVLAIGIVVDGIATMPNVMLARRFLQQRRAVADLAGLVGSAAVSMPLAVGGAGSWSLVAGTLTGNVVSAALVVALAPDRPVPGWSRSDATALLAAGLPLAATSLLAIAIVNVDYVVVGRSLGPARLGAYLLAFNLASWPVNVLSVAVRRIAVPAFAQLAAGGRLSVEVVARSMQGLGALAGVAAVSLSMLAGPVVELLYGAVWSDAVGAVRWLALLGAVRVLVDVVDDLLTALGRARDLVVCQSVWLASLGAALPVGAAVGGIEGVAAAHCVIAVVVVVPMRFAVLERASFRAWSVVRALAAPLVAGVVTGAVLTSVRPALGSPLAEVVVLGSVGLLTFAVALVVVMSLTSTDRMALRLAGSQIRRVVGSVGWRARTTRP
jgi:PST family polysaccharide transporter